MTHSIHRMAFLERFTCLGADCEDTCCKGWNMQVDAATHDKYKTQAPDLLDAVVEGPGTLIMKRDEKTDYCVKFEVGLCAIHKSRGSDFLGDACHFYPRVTRRLHGETVMTATLSCPEVVRQALYHDESFRWEKAELERIPGAMKDYAPEGLSAESAREVHSYFLKAADDKTASPERIMSRVISVAQSLQAIDSTGWPAAASFYLKSADARLAAPEPSAVDAFNLLHALMGIVKAAKAEKRDRLRATIADMEKALQVALDWEGLGIQATGDSAAAFKEMEKNWQKTYAATLTPVLRKWIAAQLSLSLFPFSGLGATLAERASILGVRFATVRLALMCACEAKGKMIDESQQVRVIQSLSRVLDHLADPALSLTIYAEPGWLREARLRALIGDV